MKLIIDIPEEKFDAAKRGIYGILEPAMENAIPIPDNATPCNFCRYNPPSSTDGKPCTMCPAEKGGE